MTTAPSTKAAPPADTPRLTLDLLAAMPAARLAEIYAAGEVPASLEVLDGEPPGRMLAWVGLLGRAPFFDPFRRLATSRAFPWLGKFFSADTPEEGRGKNRMRLGRTVQMLPFVTRFEPSSLDGRPCIRLDYNLRANPAPIRRIRDELRQVSPGIFLGPAMFEVRGEPRLVVWWALDTRA